MHKRMKAGNQENVLRNAHITGSLHTDNNAKEERAPPATVTSDNISPSHFGQLDVSNNCNYGSVTKELEETLSRGKKFRDRLYSVSPSLCRSRPSPSGEDMFHHPVVWPKKLSPVLQNQPHFLSTTQDTIDMEIDCATNDDPRMENYKCLRKSFVEEIHGCGSKFVHDSFTYRRTPSCVPVIIIDSDEEDDKGLLNTGCVSASRPKAYDGEEGIGSDVPCYMDVVVSQDGTPSPVTQDFGSWHHNLEIDDPCTITKSLEEIYREDTHINNEKVNSSCNLPFKSDEKMEIDKILQSEANQQISNLKDALASASEDKLVMESDFGENVDKEEEGETHKYESVMEFKHDVNAGIIENSTMGSCLGFGSGPLSIESYCQDDPKKDGLSDIWSEMTVALEYSKDAVLEKMIASKGVQECEHSCLLKDDLGYVCRICGIIEKSIETIFDYQWIKSIRSTRTYVSGSRNEDKYPGRVTSFSGVDNEFGHNLADTEISVHPRHMKQMKPHQLEGFNFLLQNLVTDKPRGCIMAHAPGSGKTLMIISFIQSFLAKYPHARPLIILPKGILPTWKSEFQRWEVEEIPLLDFYSTKADNRSQQLGVLQNWEEHRSILFLGYKQFSSIVCGNTNSKTEVTCQEILLKVPSLLVLDEGHTPRNDNTDVLDSLAKVKTPCKIVLSGTLYQNHVKEVFNIFKLVCPKFLRLKTSQSVVKRIMSRVQISGGSRSFFDLVEETLQHHDDFKRKIAVIKDLREMTKDVLHYYKGDFLEELPGLVDFTVLLNLTSKQKEVVKSIKQLNKFKRNSMGSAVHMHPNLKEISEIVGDSMNDEKIDKIIKKMDVKDGVKTKFFLNILGLSESAGEKLLVFSQYLLPLKFLERLLVCLKDWSPDKEMFMIYGNSNAEYRELAVRQFNNSPHAKVFFGSIKACGEGISLVGASRILILDVHLNPSVTRQAIGRAFRPGQLKKVYVYRLLAADSPEEDDHNISFRKEVISKMWFEWSEVCSERFFEMAEVSVKSCEDLFLESPLVAEDIKLLYRR